jgi:hypothetical protein
VIFPRVYKQRSVQSFLIYLPSVGPLIRRLQKTYLPRFYWAIHPNFTSKGAVTSDRWEGKSSDSSIAGDCGSYTVKKGLAIFSSPAGMSLTNSPCMAGKNNGDGKIANLFYSVFCTLFAIIRDTEECPTLGNYQTVRYSIL